MLVAEIAVLLNGLIDDALEFFRDFTVETHRCHRSTMQDGVKDSSGGISFERQKSCRHFIDDSTEGKQIAANIKWFAERLLGRHVRNRPDGTSCAGKLIVCPVAQRGMSFGITGGCGEGKFREAEIQDLGVTKTGYEDIGRLDVAMDDALAVCSFEGIGNIDAEVQNLFEFERFAVNQML